METSAGNAVDGDLNQTEDDNLHDTSNDLNETDKLQISSDLAGNDDNGEDDDEIVSSVRTKKKRKDLKFLDSDSEDDDEAKKPDEEEDRKDMGDLRLEDTDDEEEDVKQEQTAGIGKKDSDKEGGGSPRKDTMEQKYKSLIDSDTESEPEAASDKNGDNGGSESDNEEDHSQEKSDGQKKDVPKKMSAKQAMEQMRSIKSESQRLTREGGYITIPYHEPKQFSLKEFMNRKTIFKPTLKDSQKPLSLKMSPEELEEFAMKLKEREEEAKNFFKSDEKRSKGLQTAESNEDQKGDVAPESSQVEENTPETKDQENSETEVDEKRDVAMETDQEIFENEFLQDLAPATESQPSRLLESEDLFPPGTAESVTIPETEESQKDGPWNMDQDCTPKFSLSESVNEVLKERNVVESPVLKGSPNMLIDLDSGEVISPTPTGAQKLFERFLKHSAKRKAKESTMMSIVSTENGVLEITNVNVALQEDERNDEKPGAAYFKLQNNLRKAIMKKRKEEFQKRVQHTMDSDKENEDEELDEEGRVKKEKCLDEENELLVDEDENLFEEDDAVEDEEEDNDQRDAENEEQEEHEEDVENDEADDEYESDDENDDADDDDDDELATETKSLKTRIIKAFDDSDDESQQTDSFNINLIDKITSRNDPLWKDTPKTTFEDEEDELLGLCSGRFDPTQRNSVISQIPTTTQLPDGTEESELLALCSGTFQATQAATEEIPTASPSYAPKRLESSDEETEMEPEMKKPKSKEKKSKKLDFSDDEEENEPQPLNAKEDEAEDELDAGNVSDVEPEVPETYIDYDSEENEIEVKMTKVERQKKARSEFFENEAELSESEWGSADEDEKDLDRYDIGDLADEEEFDKEKLQTELGQIHMRRVLDDDIREVKKLTEMFFEDEENDGVGRQRQFKWKNLNGGFDLEAGADAEAEDKLQEGEVEGDEAEWRKMRFEREQLLQEQASKLGTPDVTLKPVVNTSVGKKLTIVDINSPTMDTSQKSSPFLIAKGLTSRGSFLVRDDVTLSKLANITKLSSGEQETGAVQIRTAKAKNFVFAAISSTDTNPAKRKLDPIENDTATSHTKKLKTATKRKIRLIDHLA